MEFSKMAKPIWWYHHHAPIQLY